MKQKKRLPQKSLSKKKQTDRNEIQIDWKFSLWSAIKGIGFLFIFSWLFYNSLYPAFIGILFLIPYQKRNRRKRAEKKKEELNMQLKDALNALTASLHAGYAVENSMKEAYQEVVTLHGKESPIAKAFQEMIKKMEVGATVESVWSDFAKKSDLEDVETFAQIFALAKRSGGGLSALIESTAGTIGEKIEVHREIITILQAKRYEQLVMNLVPLGIILYMRIGNQGFLDCLYTTVSGRAIMSACLLVYFIAYILAERIIHIRI